MRNNRLALTVIILISIIILTGCGDYRYYPAPPKVSPSPSPPPIPTRPRITQTPLPTATDTPTMTYTPSSTPTIEPSITWTLSPTPTGTRSPANTPTLTLTPTLTPEMTTTPFKFSLGSNMSFESDSNGDGMPDSWQGERLDSTDGRNCNHAHNGSCSFRMLSDVTKKKSVLQAISVNNTAGQEVIELTAWAKLLDVAIPGDVFLLEAEYTITYQNNATLVRTASFDTTKTDWQSVQIVGVTASPYKSIEIRLSFISKSGRVFFDHVTLTREG